MLVLSALMLAALGVRVYNLDAPGILPEREFRSMTIARVSYFEGEPSVPEWRREIARLQLEDLWSLEPPILEETVATVYRLVDAENVSIARVLNALVWVGGAVFVYAIGVRLMSPAGALTAAAYYLFVPLGVLVSRSFQPDSLMVLLYLISLFAILVFSERQSWPVLVAAASASSITLIVRPLPAYTILAAFVALHGRQNWRPVLDRKVLTFLLLAFGPAVVYYAYGMVGRDDLRYAEMSVRPQLLLQREFWKGWLWTATSAVGPTTLVAALAGISAAGPGVVRRFLVGLSLGYLAFGLVHTHHIHTHSYYHLQLVVIAAFGLGLLVSATLPTLAPRMVTPLSALAVLLAVVVVGFVTVEEIRAGLRAPRFESRDTARQIGEIVRHSGRVVHVARHYGQPLEYFGELAGAEWPKSTEYWLYRRAGERELSIQERLDGLGFDPEYFVVTDFEGFNSRHADLKQFLQSRCQPLVRNDEFLIYDGACARGPASM